MNQRNDRLAGSAAHVENRFPANIPKQVKRVFKRKWRVLWRIQIPVHLYGPEHDFAGFCSASLHLELDAGRVIRLYGKWRFRKFCLPT